MFLNAWFGWWIRSIVLSGNVEHSFCLISSWLGVTTIAGGDFSEKSTSKDVPALNASFSNDFDLTFIPGMCALLVSDHMHRLVRQISLKEEDCTYGSRSGEILEFGACVYVFLFLSLFYGFGFYKMVSVHSIFEV